MDVTAPKDYGDLGFDTSITGPVTVEWGGPATDIADTVLRSMPTSASAR